MNRSVLALTLSAAMLVACGGESKSADPAQPAQSSTPSASGEVTPDPGRRVITVEMVTDETGNYFSPKDIEAHRGDVIRYTLKIGVHNVRFLADSNPGKSGLPAASDMLQLPGQTYDLKVTLAEGKYYFQCDPHAALGMVGYLEVEN
jgi:plastocyanin